MFLRCFRIRFNQIMDWGNILWKNIKFKNETQRSIHENLKYSN